MKKHRQKPSTSKRQKPAGKPRAESLAMEANYLTAGQRARGIRAFSLHPGKIFTPLQRHLTQTEMAAEGWFDANGNPADPT